MRTYLICSLEICCVAVALTTCCFSADRFAHGVLMEWKTSGTVRMQPAVSIGDSTATLLIGLNLACLFLSMVTSRWSGGLLDGTRPLVPLLCSQGVLCALLMECLRE